MVKLCLPRHWSLVIGQPIVCKMILIKVGLAFETKNHTMNEFNSNIVWFAPEPPEPYGRMYILYSNALKIGIKYQINTNLLVIRI